MSAPATGVRKVSSLFQITRFAVLGFGVVYGAVHARTLKNKAEEHDHQVAYDYKLRLIKEAKEAWVKKNTPVSSGTYDFEDPNFDAESWAASLE
ncbi:ATP synthase subunit e, mitochondrial [Smittium mucronatum]|uniref:ATP synthase F(0) complex subunit e, mitochondrial n=1 Tax=Smittium mucronatum TaxID=133383 RepID=A0A1R0GMW6_9FUNG|nr:ATP synthase subunit e, mitochondrial [Smittium mucronatum]